MRKPTLAIGLAVLLLGACSVSSMRRRETGSDDVADMKARILELQRKAAVTDVELARLRQEVARLDTLLRRQEAGGVSSAEVGESGVASPSIPTPPPVVEDSDLELTASAAIRVSGEAGMTASTPSQPPAGAQPASEEETVGYRPVEPAAQALYDRGYTQFHEGRYLDAESTFQRFLQAYSETPLADNAQYWIGECRFARGDLSGALAAFRETIQHYPEGNKVPDALYKQGACLEGLGDLDGARLRYEEVVRRFPGSAAAAIAQERRASIGR